MTRTIATIALVLFAALTACSDAAGPERHSTLGRWVSDGGVADVEMALSETARSVDGAGRWTEDGVTRAFGVEGTNADGEVSLLLSFGDGPNVNFLGRFLDEDRLEGTVAGVGREEMAITFVRVSNAN